MERNRHVDEGTLHAWLDGALGAEESARVDAHVRACAACGARAAEARGLIAAASRILTALDDVPAGVVPGRRRRFVTRWPLRVAAAVVFVAVGSLVVVRQLGEFSVEPTPRRQVAAPPTPATPATPAAQPAPAPPAPRKATVKKFAPAFKERAQADSAVTLTGRVVSAKTGEPVPSASVVLTNPQVTTATNAAGSYALPIPASQAAGQQAALKVRGIGFQSKTDSVIVSAGASPHDVQLAPSGLRLSQMIVAPHDCYVTTTPGVPARLQQGDSATSWMSMGPDSIRIVFTDSTGARREIMARRSPAGLTGQMISDSGSVMPFAATRCP